MRALPRPTIRTFLSKRSGRVANGGCESRRSTEVSALTKRMGSRSRHASRRTVRRLGPRRIWRSTVPIVLRVGEQKSLSAQGIKSYSEGAPGFADIRITRDQSRFVIVGKEEGTTSLLLIKNDGGQLQYTIRVIPADAVKGFGGRENIRLDLYFVLIQDRYGHQIGLNWPGNIGSTIGPSEAAIAITGGSGQADTECISDTAADVLTELRPRAGKRLGEIVSSGHPGDCERHRGSVHLRRRVQRSSSEQLDRKRAGHRVRDKGKCSSKV